MAALSVDHPRRRGSFFGVAWRGRTYLNLLYLLLAAPIGWFYVVVFAELYTAGLGSGDPGSLLLLLLFLIGGPWAVAIFERALAHLLLRVDFTPMAPPLSRDASAWARVIAYLRNPVTWKSLLYLFARMVFGFAVYTILGVLLLVALLLIFAPALYVTAVLTQDTWHAGYVRAAATLAPAVSDWSRYFAQVEPSWLVVCFLLLALGVFLLVGELHIVNGIANGWGAFTRVMLGMSTKDAQLVEARAIAEAARRRAAEAERGRSQLILDASHELRTPVATIRAHIESLLLLEGEHLPENVRTYLGITQREAERLGTLVDDLLMLARADADELTLDVRPIDVGAVVEEVFQALEPLAERERQVSLVRNVAQELPLAFADHDRLAQVLLNLVRNAVTYTPDGGLVSLDAAPGLPGRLTLTVTDTGIGIPEEELEHVFERFYRTDASRARGTGGFGLGLSIARDLVQAMGGTIAAERVPSGGSRFVVTLRTTDRPRA